MWPDHPESPSDDWQLELSRPFPAEPPPEPPQPPTGAWEALAAYGLMLLVCFGVWTMTLAF